MLNPLTILCCIEYPNIAFFKNLAFFIGLYYSQNNLEEKEKQLDSCLIIS